MNFPQHFFCEKKSPPFLFMFVLAAPPTEVVGHLVAKPIRARVLPRSNRRRTLFSVPEQGVKYSFNESTKHKKLLITSSSDLPVMIGITLNQLKLVSSTEHVRNICLERSRYILYKREGDNMMRASGNLLNSNLGEH